MNPSSPSKTVAPEPLDAPKKRPGLLEELTNNLWYALGSLRYGRYFHISKNLPLFAPNSAGSRQARGELTLLAANQTFPFLLEFLQATGKTIPEVIDAERFCRDEEARQAAAVLEEMFNRYGSDKSRTHNYHHVYGSILKRRHDIDAVLEIGMGTNNTDVVSTMGVEGKPGASLRAFKEFLPTARIYGADVDRRILFEEDRIQTFFVDQTDPSSFQELRRHCPATLDLIIDDGLHSPNANIAVLAFGIEKLKDGGSLVVEDISEPSLPLWRVVGAMLPENYASCIVTARGAFMFVIERLATS